MFHCFYSVFYCFFLTLRLLIMFLQKKRKVLRNILLKTIFFSKTLRFLIAFLQKTRKVRRNILMRERFWFIQYSPTWPQKAPPANSGGTQERVQRHRDRTSSPATYRMRGTCLTWIKIQPLLEAGVSLTESNHVRDIDKGINSTVLGKEGVDNSVSQHQCC